MAWPEVLTGMAFEAWLVAVAGGAQISQGQALDPFATSMRKFTHASEWLELVEGGADLPERGGGGGQAAIDLRGAGLITRDPIGLSPLGRACLEAWRANGVANDTDDAELVRDLIVVLEATRLGIPQYLNMLRFWRELRSRFDPSGLLASPAWLYVVSYLNRTEAGFNPWVVIRTSPGASTGDVDAEWTALTASIRAAAAATAAASLKARVDGYATRAQGRLMFCLAMELFVLGESRSFNAASELARNWSVPRG